MSMIGELISRGLDQAETPDQFVYRAATFSDERHKDHSVPFVGVPYSNHVMEVVFLVSQITDNHHLIASAWLHDTVRMSCASYEELSQQFGFIVAGIVRSTNEGRGDFMGWLKSNAGNKDTLHLVIADLIAVVRVEAIHDWVAVKESMANLEQVLFEEGLDPRLTRVAEITLSETKAYLENVIGDTPITAPRLSTGHPSTLGVYRMLATQGWGAECRAVEHLTEVINSSTKGVSELVLEPEAETIEMLMQMNLSPEVAQEVQ